MEHGNAVVMKSNRGTPYEEVPDLVKQALRKNAYNYSQAYGFDVEQVRYYVGPMMESMRVIRPVVDLHGKVIDLPMAPIEGQWDHLFAWEIIIPDKEPDSV